MNARANTIAFALLLGWELMAQEPQRPVLALPVTDEAPVGALALPAADQATAQECAARAKARLQSLDERQCNAMARGKALPPGIDPRYALLRDEIGFDSYSGVLRGAQGTYAQRAGNALDRSLLLAELLRQQGMTVRFARGHLDAARQDQLVQRLLSAPMPTDPAIASAGPALQSLLGRVRARAARDYDALRAALGDHKPAPAPSLDALEAEVQDHFWVQVKQGEQWLDLDPAFADLKPGQRAVAEEQTYDLVPAGLYQTAVVRVVLETLTGPALQAQTVLEQAQPVVQWNDRQVFLLQVPQDNLGDGIAGALGGRQGSKWQPTLVVDGELHQGRAIDCGIAHAGGGVLDAPDGGAPASGCGTADFANASTFVAEWLEVELRFPDGRVELYRRALADRAGAELRNKGTFTAAQLQALPADEHGPRFGKDVHQIVFSSSRHDMHDYAEALADLTAAMAAAQPAATAPATAGLEVLWPFALQTFGWMFVSDERLVPALNDMPGVRLYADAPRVWIASVVHGSRNGDEVVLDQRRDKLRGVCEPGKERAVADRKLWCAALAGALEHELLADLAARAGADPKQVGTTSASLDGKELLLLAPGELAKARAVTGAEPAAHVAAALQRGSLVVVSRAAAASATTAFWEVDEQGDTRPVYGLDWNGAAVPVPSFPELGGSGPLPPPRPSYANGGGYVSQVQRGGIPGSNFRRVGPPPRGGGSEYTALLVCILAVSLEVFILGVAVAWAAGYV